MSLAVSLAQSSSGVLTVFSVFASGALLLSIWVTSDASTTKDYYLGDRRTGPFVNGLALMSAMTFLNSPGLIALAGYDGNLPLLGPVVGWVIVLLLVAEPYHNTGGFTVADTLARRLRPRPVHLAAGLATIVIDLLYLIMQLVGAGALAAPVLGTPTPGAQQAVVAALGILTILYVVIGGMRATTLVQAAKAVVLIGGGLTLAVMTMSRFGWNISELLHSAARRSGAGERFLQPGLRFGASGTTKLDSVSLELAMLLGIAGLPHLLMRFRTARSGREARRSAQWATGLSTVYFVIAGLLGLGAVGLLGTQRIIEDQPSGTTVVRLLAEALGGPIMVTVIACLAFSAVLAVSAGVTLSAATSLAHDLYGAVIKRGTASQGRELVVARTAVVVFGLVGTIVSIYAQRVSAMLLTGLIFALAASTLLPALLYAMYWPGFTTKGATWSIYGGLLSATLLTVFSPAVSGNPAALVPGADFAVFPLRNPGLVSIPVGFLLGWLGSILDKEEPGGADYGPTDVRMLTGAGAGRD